MKIEEYDGFNNTPFEGRFDMQCALAAHPVLHRFHPGFAALCNNPVMPAEFLAQVYRVISKDIIDTASLNFATYPEATNSPGHDAGLPAFSVKGRQP